ncbi:MAG: HEAT repeat domain-containing protein [Deltaproteobacteria bacterium]|nr:HEAT repeat domain-containing protein [Deltaproteobacteria bacterium]
MALRFQLFAPALFASLFIGCGGVSNCKEDGKACADVVNKAAALCARSFQSQQGDVKRKHCEHAIKTVKDQRVAAAVPGLLEILKAPETSIPYDAHRMEAVKALREIGDAKAVDAIMEAFSLDAGTSSDPLDKNSNYTNETVAETLGALGDQKACGKLKEAVSRARHDATVLKSIRSLGQLKCKDAVNDIIDVALKHPNKFMRKNAVMALGDIGDLAATDALIQMMFVEFQGVSFYREASFSLFELGPGTAQALLDTMAGKNDAVNKYFESKGGLKNTAVKAKCGFVLGDLRDPRAVDPLLEAFEAAQKEGDGVLLIYSAAPLGALGDMKAAPALKKQMLTLDGSLRDPIMRAVNQLGDRSSVPDMIKAMAAQDFLDRCVKEGHADKETCEGDLPSRVNAQKAAIDHASNLAGPEHLEAYKAAVEAEKLEEVKKYMAERLTRVEAAGACKADPACWAGKLKDANPLVREKAAWELGRLKDKGTLPALTEALADKDTFVRSAVIAAYWAFGDKSALAKVTQTLKDEEGQATFIRVNEDLRRLEVYLARL